MNKFVKADNGIYVNLDHVVTITEVPHPAQGQPYVALRLIDGETKNISGESMAELKLYLSDNSI